MVLRNIKNYKVFQILSGRGFLKYKPGPSFSALSSFALCKTKGSMTVEAALLAPIFLFLLINMVSILDMYRLQGNQMVSLAETGKEMAQYAYQEESKGNFLSAAYLQIALRQKMSGHTGYALKTPVGILGLGPDMAEFERDIISVHATTPVRPLFPGLPYANARLSTNFYIHKWNGYDPSSQIENSEEEEEYVYVAETGTVYHRNRGCVYLNPSVQVVAGALLVEKRNTSGGKYYRCELCRPRGDEVQLFITDYGDAYHSSAQCSGLKRTIYEVKLSEVGGKGPCSKCGGSGN